MHPAIPIPSFVLAMQPFDVGVFVLLTSGATASEVVARCRLRGASEELCRHEVARACAAIAAIDSTFAYAV